MKINIPTYAKNKAREGLIERRKNKAGLDRKEAKKLGINSGVERAKQIIRNKELSVKDAKRVGAFYDRFKNCRTKRCETALKLWGGRRFARSMSTKF